MSYAKWEVTRNLTRKKNSNLLLHFILFYNIFFVLIKTNSLFIMFNIWFLYLSSDNVIENIEHDPVLVRKPEMLSNQIEMSKMSFEAHIVCRCDSIFC